MIGEEMGGSRVETLKEGLSAASNKLQEAAARKGQELKRQGKDLIARQKDEIADRICSIGCAVKRASTKLRESDDTTLADTTEGIASKIEDVSAYVRERSVGGILNDVEDFTKRHSTLVLGGLFLGGLALARLLKASRPAQDPELAPGEPGMLFDADEDIDLGRNIYEEPRFEETPLGEARFGGISRPGGLEAEGFGKPEASAGPMPESDIGVRDRSEVGVNVGRTQAPPPITRTSSASGHEQRTDEGFEDEETRGRKL